MDIPFDQIRETLDRSWTERLIDVIESAADDAEVADDAEDTLSDLVDPRATERLFAIATDVTRSRAARRRACQVICDSGLSLEGDALRAWWESGDELLQVQALEDAYITEADYVREVASDPLHPLYLNAIRGLEFGFDAPEWQNYLVAALSHFDPAVRQAAAEALIWQEPVNAEDALIDVAFGDDTDGAIEAVRTLAYWQTHKTLRALLELTRHPDVERADEARDHLEEMCNEFKDTLSEYESGSPPHKSLARWMAPVQDIVAVYSVDPIDLGPPEPYESEITVFPPPTDIARQLNELDGAWRAKRELLRHDGWSQVPTSDRPALAATFVHHPDPIVRRDSCRALGEWNATDELVTLAHDPYEMVRRQAKLQLRDVPKRPDVAATLWPGIADGTVAGGEADDTLAAWLHHFDGDAHPLLVNLALNDTRDCVRWFAVNQIDDAKIADVESILDDEPYINWGLHLLILASLAELKRKPANLARFASVDNLAMATAVADLAAF